MNFSCKNCTKEPDRVKLLYTTRITKGSYRTLSKKAKMDREGMYIHEIECIGSSTCYGRKYCSGCIKKCRRTGYIDRSNRLPSNVDGRASWNKCIYKFSS